MEFLIIDIAATIALLLGHFAMLVWNRMSRGVRNATAPRAVDYPTLLKKAHSLEGSRVSRRLA